ncbi:hypothetical protein WN944_003497 [Citrus x changshan-huyou]|uniref:Uncharacterized protein n=1 Tax=Citrus x changshan-huyou TaxID=2935761 RepID=A0AAP0M4V5_9ROSI
MEDDHFSNDNLAIIEQDNDYENEPTIEHMKKITKMDKEKTIKTSTSIHHSEKFLIKRHFDEFAKAQEPSKQLNLAITKSKAQSACSNDERSTANSRSNGSMGRKSGKQPTENLRDKLNTERSSYDKEDSFDN